MLSGIRPVYARDDWQYWNETQLNVKLSDQFALRFKGEEWLRDNFSELYLANAEGGALYKPAGFLEAGFFYRYQYQKTAKGEPLGENRYFPELSLKYRWKNFSFKNRHRMEYRERTTTDTWRYRTQFRGAYTFSVKGHGVTPYLADEIFYETESHAWNQNRFSGGVGVELNKHLQLTLYYMLKSNRAGSDWDDAHILGTILAISI